MGGVSCCVEREKADGTPLRTPIADSGKDVQKRETADEGGELMMDDGRSLVSLLCKPWPLFYCVFEIHVYGCHVKCGTLVCKISTWLTPCYQLDSNTLPKLYQLLLVSTLYQTGTNFIHHLYDFIRP